MIDKFPYSPIYEDRDLDNQADTYDFLNVIVTRK